MSDSLPPVLESDAMREADRRTIEDLGIPGFTLMELAGRAVADEAAVMAGEERSDRIVILCGKGNNGGDGFVAGRVLQQLGFRVEVCLFSDPAALIGDAALHFQLLNRIREAERGIVVTQFASIDDLKAFESAGLYVDALLGTGLNSEVREPYSSVIEWMNRQRAPILAVDLPSGLHSDDGRVLGKAVRADVTVTMGALKTGLLVNDGPDYSGSIIVADIGIPIHILHSVSGEAGRTNLCQPFYVRERLPVRSREAHKYASGPTLVLGGSPSFPGAPVLAATAAARVGSGYVVVLCPEDISELLADKLMEIPVSPIKRNESGWDIEATELSLGIRWEKARALLIGPGMGREADSKTLIMDVLARSAAPVIVDADALYLLRDEKEFVRTHSGGHWIFTPHAGEFARMNTLEYTSPVHGARAFAKEWNVVVLLKGMPSVTASPDGRVVINDTGNPAVATAGTGDVLAGMVAGLVSQGLEPFDAAVAAVHIGGAIADRYVSTHAAQSMMASDVLSMLPDHLRNLD